MMVIKTLSAYRTDIENQIKNDLCDAEVTGEDDALE